MDMPATIQKNVPLAPLTTLGVGGSAEYFAQVRTESELRDALTWAKEYHQPVTILGSGSNVLIHDIGIRGLVLLPQFTEITFEEDEHGIRVVTGAGVILDDLVALLVEKELWGLENLSGIPGTVGAVPIQNVGAYGVEVKDRIQSVTVFDTTSERVYDMTNSECQFEYRASIFKQKRDNVLVIINVTFAVSTKSKPMLDYRDLRTYFEKNQTPALKEIRDAVLAIRGKKFPDWHSIGTAGSFFKNPIIPNVQYIELQKKYSELPGYFYTEHTTKLSLGWILEHVCNVRGYHEGNVGLYEKQALVLICTKGIRANEIEKFSQKIIDMVYEKTGVFVEREVTLLK